MCAVMGLVSLHSSELVELGGLAQHGESVGAPAGRGHMPVGRPGGLVLYRGIDQTSTYIKIAEARILTIGKVRGEKPE